MHHSPAKQVILKIQVPNSTVDLENCTPLGNLQGIHTKYWEMHLLDNY